MDSIAQRVLQKRQGFSLNSDAIAQRVLQKMGTRNRPPIQENENYKRAVAEAERYKQEAERAKSPLGFSWNAVKALPRAIGDTLVGTPAKFIASTAEVPGTLLRGGKTTQREYKVPGLSPFKSYQSDFEKVAGDVIEGRAGLGRAAWEMAKVPLAGLEMYGVGKGLQNVYKSGNVLARTPSAKAAKEVAYDIADTFLPTTRGIKTSGATERKLRKNLSELQMNRMRASLAVDRPRPDQYTSGVRGKLTSKSVSQKQLPEATPSRSIDTKRIIPDEVFNTEIGGNVFDELSAAKAGERLWVATPDEIGSSGRMIGVPSTFPGWVPEDLRKTSLFNEVKDALLDATLPKSKPAQRLYDLVHNEIRRRSKLPLYDFDAYDAKRLAKATEELTNKKVATTNKIVTNFSGETTTPKINYRKFIEENLGIKDRRPDTRGFDSQIAMLEKELKRPDLFVSDLANRGARTFSAPRRMITSGSRILRESGLGGRALEQLIRKQQLDADLMTGGYNKRISEALSGLSKAERVNVTDVLEGTAKPLSQKAKDAAMKMRSLYDEIAGEATKREFTIRTPDGGDVPFRPRENYAPRMYNWDDFTKGRRREEALQHLVDTGQARNKAEAAKALDTFIQENAQRRAGNLENARMFDLPGYEKDADIAGRAYAQRAADRFTQADIFGKKDEVPAALINKIANEGGDYQEAQRVFDFLFQGLPKSKIASAVTQFNLATKLDLGAITNITQSVNTATKAGILNTAKAIFKGFTKEGKDLAELANVYDEMVIVQETGLKMNRFVKAVMKPFQIVERFNRRTAGMAGKLRAEQLARVLKKNPDSAVAFRQLKSLGIDPSKIINGKLTGKDVLTAANRMSELTQFKPNVLNTPVAWRTPIGRVLMQFKSFAYMQTRFITDEIAGEARRGNIAPLLRFILAAGIISPLAYNTRNLVAGRDENDQKKSLDTRKLDKYFGAGKSFFTEPITQGAFLGETFTNPNTTSMKKLARTLGTFGGPTAGEFGNTLTSLESADRTKTVNKNWYENHELAQDDPWLMAKRQAVGSIPFVGEYLKNTAFGFEDTPAEQAEKIIKEGIKNGDFDKIAEGLSIDPYYKKPNAFRNLIKEVSEENTPIEKDQEIFYELQKRKLKPFFTP